jgi:DNA-binding XRE family transcriptional regulator
MVLTTCSSGDFHVDDLVIKRTVSQATGKFGVNPEFLKRGQLIKKWRARTPNPKRPNRHITQRQLAEMVDVPPSKIASIENGFVRLTAELEAKIREVLAITT